MTLKKILLFFGIGFLLIGNLVFISSYPDDYSNDFGSENIKVTGLSGTTPEPTKGKIIFDGKGLGEGESCSLEIGDTKFENIIPDEKSFIKLEKGEISEARFEVRSPGGEYQIGDTKINITSGNITYKNGVLELPENATLTKIKNSRVIGNNLKFLDEKDEEHFFSGDLNFDENGIPYLSRETKDKQEKFKDIFKIDDIKIEIPDTTDNIPRKPIKIFFDGETHKEEDSYISKNKNKLIIKTENAKEYINERGFIVDLSKSNYFNEKEDITFKIQPQAGSKVIVDIENKKDSPIRVHSDGSAFDFTLGNFKVDTTHLGVYQTQNWKTNIKKIRGKTTSIPNVVIDMDGGKQGLHMYVDEYKNLHFAGKKVTTTNQIEAINSHKDYFVSMNSKNHPKFIPSGSKEEYKNMLKLEEANERLANGWLNKATKKYSIEKINSFVKDSKNWDEKTREKKILIYFPEGVPFLTYQEATSILQGTNNNGIEKRKNTIKISNSFENYEGYIKIFEEYRKNHKEILDTKGTKEKETNSFGVRNAINVFNFLESYEKSHIIIHPNN